MFLVLSVDYIQAQCRCTVHPVARWTGRWTCVHVHWMETQKLPFLPFSECMHFMKKYKKKSAIIYPKHST